MVPNAITNWLHCIISFWLLNRGGGQLKTHPVCLMINGHITAQDNVLNFAYFYIQDIVPNLVHHRVSD